MDLIKANTEGLPAVESYGPGRFTIMGRTFQGGILILPTGIHDLSVATPDAIDAAVLGPLADLSPGLDLLIVGTGDDIAAVPRAVRDALAPSKAGVEAMATPPACRTFNVLLLEGRRVGAALLPVTT